jgi:hypothetical protein
VFARGREAPGSASPRWRPSELPRRVWGWFRGLKDATARSPRRSTSIGAALEFCRKVLPRRAVVFLVSDFLDDGYLDVLRHANRKHDVVAALVTDPRERAFVPAGLVTLEDAETGATRLVDTRSDAYRARVAEDAAYRAAAARGEPARVGRRRGADRRRRLGRRSAAALLPRARAPEQAMRAALIALALAALVACGSPRGPGRRGAAHADARGDHQDQRERPGQGHGQGVAAGAGAGRSAVPRADDRGRPRRDRGGAVRGRGPGPVRRAGLGPRHPAARRRRHRRGPDLHARGAGLGQAPHPAVPPAGDRRPRRRRWHGRQGARATSELLTEEIPIAIAPVDPARASQAMAPPRGALPIVVGGWAWWQIALAIAAAWARW